MSRPAPSSWCCSRCAVTKPFDDEHFKPKASAKWGRDKICRACRIEYRRAYNNGLKPADWRDWLGEGCWLCGDVAVRLDYDNTTDEARGAVCARCGAGLKLLGDDPDRLTKAAEIITAHRTRWLCS